MDGAGSNKARLALYQPAFVAISAVRRNISGNKQRRLSRDPAGCPRQYVQTSLQPPLGSRISTASEAGVPLLLGASD
jgi:hypothetical protein